MKKVLAILLVVTMSLAMFACAAPAAPSESAAAPKESVAASDAPAAAPDESAAAKGDGKYTIALVPKDSTNPWFVRMEEGVKKFQSENPDMVVFQKGPAETDAAQQIQVVEDLIAQGVNALCVVPHDPGAMEEVLKKARDKGIVVITHEASSEQNCDYDIEAFNFDEYGAYIMDTLAKAMGEKGKYITMVGSLTNDSHNLEADGAIKAQKEKYPDMELIDERIVTDDNAETAYQKAKEILKKYPDIKGIVGTSSFDAPGAGRAIEEQGLIGKVFAVGTGMPQTNKELLNTGAVSALTLWDPAEAGYAMCKLATMVLNGDKIETGLDLGLKGYDNLTLDKKVLTGAAYITLTKENVDNYNF
ncbi:MAG: autoinducer 2 ABC transporter substrate-binding protein [Christensenella sp.]